MYDEEDSEPTLRDNKLTSPLIFSMVGSALGFLQHGYLHFLMHSPFVRKIQLLSLEKEASEKDPLLYSFLILISIISFPVGALWGVFLCGSLANRYGRKPTLLINNGVSIISSAILCFDRVIQLYGFTMFARFLAGIGSGSFSCAIPVYILETAPLNLRGALVTASILFLNWGHLLGQILTMPQIWGNQEDYLLIMGITAVFGIISDLLLLGCFESPRFLFIQKDDEANARQVLKKLRGVEDVEDEMEELRQEQLAESSQKNMTAWRLLHFHGLRWHLFTVLVLVSGSQFVGVNMALVFLENVYKALALSAKAMTLIPLAGNVIVQMMLLTTVFTVETLGRRFLLLTGLLICSISNVGLVFSLQFLVGNPTALCTRVNSPSLAFISIVLFILFFMGDITGPASITSVIVGELFLQSSRMPAFVIAGFTSWISHVFSMVMFLLTEPHLGSYCLLLFWPFSILTFIYIFRMVPETSSKTFQEIQRSMAARIRKNSRRTGAE